MAKLIQSWAKSTFDALHGPGVYVFESKGKAIYVGRSGDIIIRLEAHKQRAFNHECDRVKVFSCISAREAWDLEKRMIRKWAPRYNIKHNQAQSRKRGIRSLHKRQTEFCDAWASQHGPKHGPMNWISS